MIRAAAVIGLTLALASCERAQELQQVAYCHLYPSRCVPVPLPPERPAVAEPAPPLASPETPAPSLPPAAKRSTLPPKPVKPKPAPKPRPTVRVVPKDEAGADLPWPCWMVRSQAAGKSDAELRALARANNVNLTPKQERQARACLKGK